MKIWRNNCTVHVLLCIVALSASEHFSLWRRVAQRLCRDVNWRKCQITLCEGRLLPEHKLRFVVWVLRLTTFRPAVWKCCVWAGSCYTNSKEGKLDTPCYCIRKISIFFARTVTLICFYAHFTFRLFCHFIHDDNDKWLSVFRRFAHRPNSNAHMPPMCVVCDCTARAHTHNMFRTCVPMRLRLCGMLFNRPKQRKLSRKA